MAGVVPEANAAQNKHLLSRAHRLLCPQATPAVMDPQTTR